VSGLGAAGPEDLVQAAADADLVTLRLQVVTRSGRVLRVQEAAHHPVLADVGLLA
jgi:hypothetical protein